MEAVLWRAFPWDPEAAPGEPFTPSHVPVRQGAGRFDVSASPVLYLAESPEHAVAEKLQRYRGLELAAPDLVEWGHHLALVPVELADRVREAVVNLCDPDELARWRIGPDTLASRDYRRTRAVAEALYEERKTGLRWWSAFSGDWHTVVVFCSRLSKGDLIFGAPDRLGLDTPALRVAAAEVGVHLVRYGRSRR